MDHKMRKNNSYTLRDMYRKMPNKTDYSCFKRITECMCKIILECLEDASDGFKMPSGLGYIRICKYRPKTYTDKSLSVDYKASKEYGKRIYHLNEHCGGYKFRLFWSKQPYTFSDRYKYQLVFVRANKRRLAQLIFNHKDYINIDDIQVYNM